MKHIAKRCISVVLVFAMILTLPNFGVMAEKAMIIEDNTDEMEGAVSEAAAETEGQEREPAVDIIEDVSLPDDMEKVPDEVLDITLDEEEIIVTRSQPEGSDLDSESEVQITKGEIEMSESAEENDGYKTAPVESGLTFGDYTL